jgi:hypothetical protein
MHQHSTLIDAIGARAVSERFALKPQALHNWRKRGVPVVRRLAFKELAERASIEVPADFLAPLAQ